MRNPFDLTPESSALQRLCALGLAPFAGAALVIVLPFLGIALCFEAMWRASVELGKKAALRLGYIE